MTNKDHNSLDDLKIIDCPRDAMQGIKTFIPTELKIRYINALLKIGFDTLDCGSFVSPKAIPQMRDTGEVLNGLDLSNTSTELLCIIANYRGAKEAVEYPQIRYLGFPFSISETFQLRNTHATREEAFERIREIQDLCLRKNKDLVVYFSMCFGNPYGDLWHPDIIVYWAERFKAIGVKIISLSDTIGMGSPSLIGQVVQTMKGDFNQIEFGLHLHTLQDNWKEKIDTAFSFGCLRYDGAIKGYGGCPMAQNDLIGNMPTEHLLNYFKDKGVNKFKLEYLPEVLEISNEIFL
ncbi:beta/alpha barrel domain-containing protein [Membranihabitans marinus]|uniref:hydroxymethylglutaryl-CoA lyase n=1 Tax=Membranihabitans marinus TaxID=1227546 RepID=UPI001F17FFE5|nr:hydroxymethylglutaryl-CoA lyase [Membranihabitans marinus]